MRRRKIMLMTTERLFRDDAVRVYRLNMIPLLTRISSSFSLDVEVSSVIKAVEYRDGN